jgi:hypothetical protein
MKVASVEEAWVPLGSSVKDAAAKNTTVPIPSMANARRIVDLFV